MASVGHCVLSRMICLLLLLDLHSHLCEAGDTDVLSQNAMFHDGRCIWATRGGNMTSAESICGRFGGSVITLNTSDVGNIVLNSLGVSNDTAFYVNIVSDWLIPPGDLSRDDQSKICVKLLNEEFVAENCTIELPVTICESYEISHCDKIYPVNRLELETETGHVTLAQPAMSVTRSETTVTSTRQPETMSTATTASSLPTITSFSTTTASSTPSSSVTTSSSLTTTTASTTSSSSATTSSSLTTTAATSSTLTPQTTSSPTTAPSSSATTSLTTAPSTASSATTTTSLTTAPSTASSATTTTSLTTAPPTAPSATTTISLTTAPSTAPPATTTTSLTTAPSTAPPTTTSLTTAPSTAPPATTTTSLTTAPSTALSLTTVPSSRATALSTSTATLFLTTEPSSKSTIISLTTAAIHSSATTLSSSKGTTAQVPPSRSSTTHNQDGMNETVSTERSVELTRLGGTLLIHDVPHDSLNTSSSDDTGTESTTSNGADNNSTYIMAHTTENNTPAVDPSEILQIPVGNGTRNVSWGNFVSELLGKVNTLETNETTTSAGPRNVTIETPELAQHNTTHTNHSGPPVTEIKFQVSGMNNGSVRPWTGSPPHHIPPPKVHNVSKVLNALKQQQTADNKTLKVFADTIVIIGSDVHIAGETDAVKISILEDMMDVGEHLMAKIPVSMKTVVMTTDAIGLESKMLVPDEGDNNTMVAFKPVHQKTNIQLSKSIFESSASKFVRVSALTYKKIDTVLKASNKHISSNVVSVTIHYIHDNISETGVIKIDNAIYFEMETDVDGNRHEDERLCTFWDVHERKWSTNGCDLVDKNRTHTCCQCNHLTSFAILVMYMETQDISAQSQQALFTMTTVGCSLSIACLVMALICYIYLRMLTNEKIMIHANLSVALLLAQIVFVSSSDAHKDPIACKAVAVLLHFLFMATFTWMMVEGIALYLCCTKGIFQHRDMRTKYFLLGWGLPVVIVVISMAARFPNYGTGPQYSCWLSVKDGLIWAFLAPMLIIVLMNIGVMGLVVKVFLTLRANADKTEVARLRGSLRAMLTLLPLLGVTWIFSLLVPFSVVFHYFFVITNTVQGMCIFFLHCICNEQIRKKFYEKRRRWSTTRTGSDADMTFPTRRKTGSFDAIRATVPTTTQIPAEYATRTAWA